MQLHNEEIKKGQRVYWAAFGNNEVRENGTVTKVFQNVFTVLFDNGKEYNFNSSGICTTSSLRVFGGLGKIPLEYRNIIGFEIRAMRDGGVQTVGAMRFVNE